MVAERGMLAFTRDALVLRALERDAAGLGLVLVAPDAERPPPIGVVVVDLDEPGAVERVGAFRALHPDAFIAGHTVAVAREHWNAAQAAGCDLVTNRGAFAAQLRRRLPPPGVARRQRFALVDAADVPGRIGLLARFAETPVGPVALYHLGGVLFVAADRCPHAGAVLSEGECEAGVVTCPRHGSRFDVRTGERVRGPSDDPIATYDVVVEDGRVFLVYE